ncbi:hypothetical protein ACOMHN_034368 [Nucella lapillus]
MSMMRARVQGHRWVDHPAAAVMKARVPGQWVDCPAAVVMEARGQGRCWIDHPAVAVMEARVQGRHWVDRPSVGGIPVPVRKGAQSHRPVLAAVSEFQQNVLQNATTQHKPTQARPTFGSSQGVGKGTLTLSDGCEKASRNPAPLSAQVCQSAVVAAAASSSSDLELNTVWKTPRTLSAVARSCPMAESSCRTPGNGPDGFVSLVKEQEQIGLEFQKDGNALKSILTGAGIAAAPGSGTLSEMFRPQRATEGQGRPVYTPAKHSAQMRNSVYATKEPSMSLIDSCNQYKKFLRESRCLDGQSESASPELARSPPKMAAVRESPLLKGMRFSSVRGSVYPKWSHPGLFSPFTEQRGLSRPEPFSKESDDVASRAEEEMEKPGTPKTPVSTFRRVLVTPLSSRQRVHGGFVAATPSTTSSAYSRVALTPVRRVLIQSSSKTDVKTESTANTVPRSVKKKLRWADILSDCSPDQQQSEQTAQVPENARKNNTDSSCTTPSTFSHKSVYPEPARYRLTETSAEKSTTYDNTTSADHNDMGNLPPTPIHGTEFSLSSQPNRPFPVRPRDPSASLHPVREGDERESPLSGVDKRGLITERRGVVADTCGSSSAGNSTSQTDILARLQVLEQREHGIQNEMLLLRMAMMKQKQVAYGDDDDRTHPRTNPHQYRHFSTHQIGEKDGNDDGDDRTYPGPNHHQYHQPSTNQVHEKKKQDAYGDDRSHSRRNHLHRQSSTDQIHEKKKQEANDNNSTHQEPNQHQHRQFSTDQIQNPTVGQISSSGDSSASAFQIVFQGARFQLPQTSFLDHKRVSVPSQAWSTSANKYTPQLLTSSGRCPTKVGSGTDSSESSSYNIGSSVRTSMACGTAVLNSYAGDALPDIWPSENTEAARLLKREDWSCNLMRYGDKDSSDVVPWSRNNLIQCGDEDIDNVECDDKNSDDNAKSAEEEVETQPSSTDTASSLSPSASEHKMECEEDTFRKKVEETCEQLRPKADDRQVSGTQFGLRTEQQESDSRINSVQRKRNPTQVSSAGLFLTPQDHILQAKTGESLDMDIEEAEDEGIERWDEGNLAVPQKRGEPSPEALPGKLYGRTPRVNPVSVIVQPKVVSASPPVNEQSKGLRVSPPIWTTLALQCAASSNSLQTPNPEHQQVPTESSEAHTHMELQQATPAPSEMHPCVELQQGTTTLSEAHTCMELEQVTTTLSEAQHTRMEFQQVTAEAPSEAHTPQPDTATSTPLSKGVDAVKKTSIPGPRTEARKGDTPSPIVGGFGVLHSPNPKQSLRGASPARGFRAHSPSTKQPPRGFKGHNPSPPKRSPLHGTLRPAKHGRGSGCDALKNTDLFLEALVEDECALYAGRLHSFFRNPATVVCDRQESPDPVARVLSEGDDMVNE